MQRGEPTDRKRLKKLALKYLDIDSHKGPHVTAVVDSMSGARVHPARQEVR